MTASVSAYFNTLKTRFLDADGRIKWGALVGGIGGSLFMYWWSLGIASWNAIRAAQNQLFRRLAADADIALSGLGSTIQTELAATWDAWNAGLLSLPVNTLALLATVAVLALLARYFRRLV